MDKTEEILTIAQEECGEFVQVVSKVRRFGLDTNREKLVQEAGDILCMIELMLENGIIHGDALTVAKDAKREKLKIWSKIFEQNKND